MVEIDPEPPLPDDRWSEPFTHQAHDSYDRCDEGHLYSTMSLFRQRDYLLAHGRLPDLGCPHCKRTEIASDRATNQAWQGRASQRASRQRYVDEALF